MEEQKDITGLLELMLQPGFTAENNIITAVNSAARSLMIAPGTDVRQLLVTGKQEYETFQEGCLYLKITAGSRERGACVKRRGQQDIFSLDQEEQELQVLSLAAMEMRQPLLNAMISADQLDVSPETREYLARLNRGLHQLHRILNNMSDAPRFSSVSHMEIWNLSSVFEEIFEKARTLVEKSGAELKFQGLKEEILSLADREQLERAVLNMLSNAIKFSPQGAVLNARLTRHGKLLQLSLTDTGCGIGEDILGTIFRRYLRQPGIEDSRRGLGLGMVLIRCAALSHGGTVLIDQPKGKGTRITMTMEIHQGRCDTLRLPIDLPSGQDLGLIELSDCLPASEYEK